VDDAVEGILTAAVVHNDPQPVNLGTGREIKISDLADLIARLTGFDGRIVWNTDYPNGQPRRRLDTSRAKALLNWRARIDLEEGLRRTIAWWRDSK